MENKIILISGSKGKSSCAYVLSSYLSSLDYNVGLFCSNYIKYNNKVLSYIPNLETRQELEYYLYCMREADYIIIEVSERSLKKGVYDNLDVELKLLTNYLPGFNIHRNTDDYYSLKIHFWDNIKSKKRLINISNEEQNYFTVNDEESFDVTEISENIKNKLEHLDTLEDNIFIMGNNSYSNKRDKSHDIVLANVWKCLETLEMEDEEYFLEVFDHYTANQQHQQYRIKNRNIIIDSAGISAVETFFKNNSVDKSKIRALITIPTGTREIVQRQLQETDYVSTNKYQTTNSRVESSLLIFGYNLYLILHNVEQLPDSQIMKKHIHKVPQNWKIEKNINYSNNLLLKELEEWTVIALRSGGYDTLSKNNNFVSTLWPCSVDTMKEYFACNLDVFYDIYNKIITNTDNTVVVEAINYVKEIVEYSHDQKTYYVNKAEELGLVNYYMVSSHGNVKPYDWLTLTDIFPATTKCFVNRKDAIIELLNSSNEGDTVIICGRGGNPFYTTTEGNIVKESDEEIVKSWGELYE